MKSPVKMSHSQTYLDCCGQIYHSYSPIPHMPRIPRIDKYLDSWLKRTQFVKILTESYTVGRQFLQFVGLLGIGLKSFELIKTLATNSPI